MRYQRCVARSTIAAALGCSALVICPEFAKASLVQLASWMPIPNTTSSAYPEINYTAAGLQTGAGAIGNTPGDGNLPPSQQMPGGLELDTVAYAPVPYSFNSSIYTGGTGYYDTSLTFTGLAPVGPAQQINFGTFIQDSQALGPGTFTLTATDVSPVNSEVLLMGTVTGATLVTGVDGGTSGATFNADGITYTGGAIVASLPSYAELSGNDMSISMVTVNPPFGVSTQTGQLNPFTSNATGIFDLNLSGANTSVPEPATLSVLALGAGSLMLRRRQAKN
jgi:hypothetical protein